MLEEEEDEEEEEEDDAFAGVFATGVPAAGFCAKTGNAPTARHETIAKLRIRKIPGQDS